MNKKQKIEKCREILNRYKPGEFVSRIEDLEFLDDILMDHKWREQKIQGQPYYIYVDIAKGYNTKCFNIKREDGTTTDFSFYECIYPTRTARADFVKAARKAISVDILEYKTMHFSKMVKRLCPLCGIHVIPGNSHVDHYDIKFRDLISNFIKEYKIKNFNIYLPDPNDYDNTIGVEFVNKDMEKLWVDYHKKNAKLRAICGTCNLQLG